MVFLSKFVGVVAATCIVGSAIAHPGEHHDHQEIERQVQVRDQMASAAKRSIDSCSNSLKHRAVNARSIARRAGVARELRARRDIKALPKKYRRDLATLEVYEAINHNQTGSVNYTIGTDDATIFSANTSCILTPEVTDGPYYVTGEAIRKNVTEGQQGVPLYLEVQYLDINTCLPVPDIYVDIWNCNATGVYGGINETGNVADGGWDSTFLRGIQATDADGVVAFETIFPGHYEGRTTHTHLLSHMNVTVLPNSTISGGAVNHIGQLFWNEDLRSAVEATYPYNTNTKAIVSNAEDMFSTVQADNDYDPFPEYMYLSDDITDGLLAWIQIGINVTANYTSVASVAAVLQADGGHESLTGGFWGNGTAPGNGTSPSGAFPSDSVPVSSAVSSSTAV